MPEVEIKDKNNNTIGKMALRDDVFSTGGKQGVIHDAVVNFLANQRQGTHATKTKGLVSGGGKKPWRQKHTGRARAGSSRSPIWRGGGIVFGPQPRDYSYAMPKKARRLAFFTALGHKIADGEVVVIEDFGLDKPRTKDMVAILKNLGLLGSGVLIVLPDKDENVVLSARNVPGVGIARASDLNAYDVVAFKRLLMTKAAITQIEEMKGI